MANPFTFVGELGVTSDGSGLSIMGNRAYDPGLDRFIERDPIGYFGGTSNLYQYALNDPVNMVDPNGTDPITGITVTILVQQGLGYNGSTLGPILQQALSSPAAQTYTANTVQESIENFGTSSTVAGEDSVLATSVGGAPLAIVVPEAVAGGALAVQLKSLNTDLQSVPTPSEIGPYVNNLEREIINRFRHSTNQVE